MIIGHNFFFIHNPKAAGTSIRRQLEEYAIPGHPYRDEYQIYSEKLDRTLEWFHLTASDCEIVLPQAVTKPRFRFGFVRNPYDRFFSSFNEHVYQHNLSPSLDINKFILSLDRMSLRYDWKYIHLCPQHYFFYKNLSVQADFIGRFERLEDDWKSVCHLIGIQYRGLNKLKTTSRYGSYTRYTVQDLSDDSILHLDRLYSRDFDLFGYQSLTDRVEEDNHTNRIESIQGAPSRLPIVESQLTLGQQCAYWRSKYNAIVSSQDTVNNG